MSKFKNGIIMGLIILISLGISNIILDSNAKENYNVTYDHAIYNSLSIPTIINNITWDEDYYDTGKDITLDNLGNIYVSGYTSSSTSWGTHDVFVVKFDNTGKELWSKIWWGEESDYAEGIAVDFEGNVIITGYTRSFGGYDKDMFVVKYDNSGKKLWYDVWGGNGEEIGESIVVDSIGNILITGEMSNQANNRDVFIVKYDNAGVLIWNKTWGGMDNDVGRDITLDSSENILVTGYTQSYSYYDHAKPFLIKFDLNGNLLWEHIIYKDSETKSGSASGIEIDSLDNIFLVGKQNDGSMVLIKYNSLGIQLWNKSIIPNAIGLALAISKSDNIYITGIESKDDGTFVFAYNSSGTQLWYHSWQEYGNEGKGYNIAVDSYEKAYVVGKIPDLDENSKENRLDMFIQMYNNLTKDYPPSKVAYLKVKDKTKNTITLKWNKNPESDIKYYKIYRNDTLVGISEKNIYIDKELQCETYYKYIISAVNEKMLESLNSSMLIVKTSKDIPVYVSGIELVNKTLYKVCLSWNANPEQNIDHYNIYRKLDLNGLYPELIGSTKNTNFTDTGVIPGRNYNYYVSAVNNLNYENGYSRPLKVSIDRDIPVMVTGIRITKLGSTEITILWNPNPEKNIIYYQIYRNGLYIGYTTDLSYTDVDLSPETNYKYTISAINEWHEVSSLSNPISVFTKPKIITMSYEILAIIIISSVFIIGITSVSITGIVIISNKKSEKFENKNFKPNKLYSREETLSLKRIIFCEYCGVKLKDKAKYCVKCGAKIQSFRSSELIKRSKNIITDQITSITLPLNPKDSNFKKGTFKFKETILGKPYTQLLKMLLMLLIFILINPIITSLNIVENLALDILIIIAGTLVLGSVLFPFEIFTRNNNCLILNKYLIILKQRKKEKVVYFKDILRINYIKKKNIIKENICKILLKNNEIIDLKLDHFLISMKKKERVNYLQRIIDTYSKANKVDSNSKISLDYKYIQSKQGNYFGYFAIFSGIIGFFIFGLVLGLLSILIGIRGRYIDRNKKYCIIAIFLGIFDLLGWAFIILLL